MKSTELRIGNYVIDPNGEITKVDSINEEGIDLGMNSEHDHPEVTFIEAFYKFEDLKGIPLTEEILLKCGFNQENGIMSYVLDDYSDVKIVYETLANHYRLYPYTYKILHLHHLQNIFHAITGVELEVSI